MTGRRHFIHDGERMVEVFPVRRERKTPYVISDYHEPFRSMADGKMYDSKSRYRAELKARGLIEVGNERAAVMEQPNIDPDPTPELMQSLSERGLL